MTSTPAFPNLVTYDRKTIDLHSASATRTPTFTFPPIAETDSPILILNTSNPFATCLHLKSWMLRQHDDPAYSAPGILRMDHQELDKIDRQKEGWVVVAPGVARMDGREWLNRDEDDEDVEEEGQDADREGQLTVTVLAVLVKSDPRIRWLYTPLPITSLLSDLEDQGLVELQTVLDPGTSSYKHRRMHTFLRETFTAAIRMPEAPDFVNALQISDFCPSILDPDHAVSRLEEESWLYWNTPKPDEFLFPAPSSSHPQQGKEQDESSSQGKEKKEKDVAALKSVEPTDDRYAHYLHPAEREVASLARLKCAEYLFVKRNFFRAFWKECYRSDKMADSAAATASASTSNPVPSRRVDPQHVVASAVSPGASTSGGGRQDTPFSATATSTPAPSTRDDTPLPPTSASTSARRDGRTAGFNKSKRNRVRTERAHQLWLESEYKCRVTQARTLVIGWRVLGFLDEERFVGWIREGWGGSSEEEEDEEGEEGEG